MRGEMTQQPVPSDSAPPPRGKPTIGITMGDPAGIGPQIVVKALMDPRLRTSARLVIYGLNETGKSSWQAAIYAGLCGMRRARGAPMKHERRPEARRANKRWPEAF